MKRLLANSIPKGTTDVFGVEARTKDYVLGKIKDVYEKYGFEPLYTPIIENAEVFNGHHGEGEKLLFKLLDKENNELVLKYDSTVPLARVVSMYDTISMPYKRYQLQQSFRDDSVDKGHFREFIQCDCDIVATESLISDAEIAMIAYDGLSRIGFDDFTIRLNHRKIIQGIAEKSGEFSKDAILEIQRAIDYADKVIKNGVEGIRTDLSKRGISGSVIETICEVVQLIRNTPMETLDNIEEYFSDYPVALDGINELKEILSYIPHKMISKMKIDFTLARGADYYTGFIIEAVINDIKLGAVLGGGRFDNLVEAFSDKKVPAVGMAFGLERLLTAMDELGLTQKLDILPDKILILENSEFKKEIISCATYLREEFDVSILYGEHDNDYVLDYASKGGFQMLLELKEKNLLEITFLNDDHQYMHKVIDKFLSSNYEYVEKTK